MDNLHGLKCKSTVKNLLSPAPSHSVLFGSNLSYTAYPSREVLCTHPFPIYMKIFKHKRSCRDCTVTIP